MDPNRSKDLHRQRAGPKVRSHVSLRSQRRSDNGKICYVVTWYPYRGERRRLTFLDATTANQEANRIEELMRIGCEEVSKIPREQLVAINLYRLQYPNVSPHEVYQFYFEHHNHRSAIYEFTLEHAGKSFIQSRNDPEKFSDRQRQTVRQHMTRLIAAFGRILVREITLESLAQYIEKTVGGAPKTRWNHTTTLISFGRWMRIKKKWFP